MKKHTNPFVYIVILLLIIVFGKSYGQTNINYKLDGRINVITTAVPFLMITPDSRSGALGDAGVALPPDANSIHWNPAKLAFVPNDFSLSLSYVPWLKKLVPDIALSYLTGYKKIDEFSAFAASLRYFSLGDIEFTNDFGDYNGSFRPYEMALDGSYARKLSDNFSLGLSLRFIYSNLAGKTTFSNGTETKPGIAFSGDLAAFWKLKETTLFNRPLNTNFGINISNVGSKITYTKETDKDFIPMNLRIGGFTNIQIDEYNKIALLLDLNKLLVPTSPTYKYDSLQGGFVIDAGKTPDVPVMKGIFQSFSDAPGGLSEELREISPSIGAEYWYNNQFAARAGFFYEDKTKGNRQYLTLGIGVKYSIFNLDVSYLIPTNNKTASETSPLENTVRFTLLFNFGSDQLKRKK